MRKEWKRPDIPWRLAAVMEHRGITTITDLRRRLQKHVPISYDQTRRIVSGDFVELPSFAVLRALCIALQCNPDDLIAIAHRPTNPEFALAVPKPKAWKPRRDRQQKRHVPRLGALSETSLPVEIY